MKNKNTISEILGEKEKVFAIGDVIKTPVGNLCKVDNILDNKLLCLIDIDNGCYYTLSKDICEIVEKIEIGNKRRKKAIGKRIRKVVEKVLNIEELDEKTRIKLTISIENMLRYYRNTFLLGYKTEELKRILDIKEYYKNNNSAARYEYFRNLVFEYLDYIVEKKEIKSFNDKKNIYIMNAMTIVHFQLNDSFVKKIVKDYIKSKEEIKNEN